MTVIVPSHIADDEGPDLTFIGRLAAWTVSSWPDRATDDVVITARQRIHYLSRHPDVVGLEDIINRAVTDPDEVHRYTRNHQTANFYARISDTKGGRYLLVSVAITYRNDRQNSVLSVRRARESELVKARGKGLMVWRRGS